MGQRVRELELLQRALAGLDLAESRRSFAKLVRAPKRGAESQRPLSAFAHAAVAERIAAVYALMPRALDEANIESQHALRITFKRLRYAVEVFAPCYGDDFDALHDTLTAFQDELGDLHDLHVFLDMVREPERRAAAMAAGVSAEDLGAVEALLEKRAHREFAQFAKLAQEHPAGELLPALLLPLSRAAEPEPVPSLQPRRRRLTADAAAAEPQALAGRRRGRAAAAGDPDRRLRRLRDRSADRRRRRAVGGARRQPALRRPSRASRAPIVGRTAAAAPARPVAGRARRRRRRAAPSRRARPGRPSVSPRSSRG